MEFTDKFSNVKQSQFSPDNQYFALSYGNKLSIKQVQKLNNPTKLIFTYPDEVTYFEFSPNSKFILALISKSNLMIARSIYEEDWITKIQDDSVSILHARWSPDSLHIMVFTDFQLRASIYSLVDKKIYHIKNPKYPDKGISFSSDGKFMCLAERKDTKDYIGIYHCGEWQLINHIQVETYDLNDIYWMPDSNSIIVWDSCLEYKMLVVCPAQGIKARIQPYEYALEILSQITKFVGIKYLKASPDHRFVSIGSYDEKLRIINSLTWTVIIELEHKLDQSVDTIIYKEEQINSSHSKKSTKYVRTDKQSLKLPSIKIPTDKPDPPLGYNCLINVGVGSISWSHNNQYIATKNDNQPQILYIWEVWQIY